MRRLLIVFVMLFIFISGVSAFSEGTLKNLITGSAVVNKPPTATQGYPADTMVVNTATPVVTWTYSDKENDPQTAYMIYIDKIRTFDENPLLEAGIGSATSHKITIRTGDGRYYWMIRVKDTYAWGPWSQPRELIIDTTAKVCSDGTPFYKCSVNQPTYCDGGVLISDCSECGCPAGKVCKSDGNCEAQLCSDGTIYGKCSKQKPKFCNYGELIDVCSLCGCPIGQECQSDGSCKTTILIITEEEKVLPPEKISPVKIFFGKIAAFFRNLF